MCANRAPPFLSVLCAQRIEMNRKLIIVALVVVIVALLGLAGTMAYRIASKSNSGQDNSGTEQAAVYKAVAPDPFAGRENDAIDIVRSYKVFAPAYIDAVYDAVKNSRPVGDVPMERVTVDSLVESQFLEKHLNMSFLKRGAWRALHLDTDSGDVQTPDPLYEVYLDYTDESVVVGPVWIVNLQSNTVIARNNMAAAFDRTIGNYEQIESDLKRSGGVVRAITSHKFDSGIDLGGVLLLYFLKKTTDSKHVDDQIIGWTVMHELEDEFSAYFQWKELSETRVAKFRFNWDTKRLTPVGLYAADLMSIGNNMSAVEPVNIYPNEYTNNLHIPRNERWPRNHSCRKGEYKALCTAFVKVLEQQEFVSAMAWLLTNGEANASRRVNMCKEKRECGWTMKIASQTENPDNNPALMEIGYKYKLNNIERRVRFLVDSDKETIMPLDKLSQWAYWSVSPRT